MQKLLRLIILMLSTQNFLFAQDDLTLEKVQGEGLTSPYIKCIRQDKNGFIWFGTEEGLFRYDGYNFVQAKNVSDNTETPGNNNIEFLYPEKNDLLWVGSRGGLRCVDVNNMTIKDFPSPVTFTVYSLLPKNDSVFFAGTSVGLYLFYKNSAKWERVASVEKNVFIRSMCRDRQGNIYITSHSGLYCYDEKNNTCRHFPLPATLLKTSLQIAHQAILSRDNTLWVTSWNAGLLRFDTRTMKFIDAFLSNTCYDLKEAEDGNILLANAESGVAIFNTEKKTFTLHTVQFDDDKDANDRVYALFTDKTGITWFGTENGVYKNDPNHIRFSNVNFIPYKNKPFPLGDLAPITLLCSKQGLWWMGTYRGLFLLDPHSGLLKEYNKEVDISATSAVFNILEDTIGNVWLTARNKLICLSTDGNNDRLQLHKKTFTSASIKTVITSACLSAEKKIWLGTHRDGIFLFDPVKGTFTPYFNIDTTANGNKTEIRTIFQLPDKSLLAGGEHTGLLHLNPVTGKYEHVALFNKIANGSSFTINSIAEDAHHQIWIGTEGNGLWQMDKDFKSLNQYTVKDGFPSMNIASILSDDNNYLWILGDGGIIKFHPPDKEITVFDKESGIRNPYSLLALMKAPDGNIFVGDMKCVHVFNHAQKAKNLSKPVILITGFRIFDTPYPLTENKSIELDYNQNYFSFDYVGPNYTQPNRNTYAYMLKGLDKKWNMAGTRRYVSYANLEEGNYTFEVKACNNEGIWSDHPTTLSLIIRPPFWHRWWFYLLVAMAICSIIYSFYLVKQRQMKSREQLRNKIARDLHDDIGSTLSSINIFSKIALQKVHTDKNASGELLLKINERSEKTMEALSDIVWSINTQKDDMNNVLAKMLEYLGEVAEPSGIHYEFIVDQPVYHVQVNMEIRKEVYLIFKESINNAIKYAACKSLLVEIKKDQKNLRLLIKDDGKGFDMNNIIPGNGINNMQERARKLKAEIKIESAINKGTTILLTLPITRNR